MSIPISSDRSKTLITPRILRSQHELLSALSESLQTSGLYRDQAQAFLSGVLSDIWNEAEFIAKRLRRSPEELL